MKKALIVFGTTAALLAAMLSPTISFAAENVGGNVQQNEINNASMALSFVYVTVGKKTELGEVQAHSYVITSGQENVSVNRGVVYGKKVGVATVDSYDKKGRFIKTYSIIVGPDL